MTTDAAPDADDARCIDFYFSATGRLRVYPDGRMTSQVKARNNRWVTADPTAGGYSDMMTDLALAEIAATAFARMGG
jgi:hypothetical protein